jgi:hypothetical protein
VTEAEITQAIGMRLAATPGLPEIVWENAKANPAIPHIRAEIVFAGADDPTIAGGAEVKTGFMMASVITALDEFTTPGLTTARTIADRFAYGLQLDGVLIYKPAEVLRGYRDGANWRTPVRVSFRAF